MGRYVVFQTARASAGGGSGFTSSVGSVVPKGSGTQVCRMVAL